MKLVRGDRPHKDEAGYILIFDSGHRVTCMTGATLEGVAGRAALEKAKERGKAEVRGGTLYWRAP